MTILLKYRFFKFNHKGHKWLRKEHKENGNFIQHINVNNIICATEPIIIQN